MHVDGFRFDLAATLGRRRRRSTSTSSFFDLVAQDPVVSRAKLIAEPWDVGQMDSYDLGRFPPLWREWNGQYRDSMRDFWRGPTARRGASSRPGSAGPPDLYGAARRRPTASVNLITVHDGFTLRDLVSYDGKHNEANGEYNRDGTDRQPLVELRRRGPDRRPGRQCAALPAAAGDAHYAAAVLRPAVAARRAMRSAAPSSATTTPTARTTRSPGSTGTAPDRELLGLRQAAHRAARAHPVFRRNRFLTGADASELGWFTPAGTVMTQPDWADNDARCLAIYLDGTDDPGRGRTARRCAMTTSWSWSTAGGSRWISSCRRPGPGRVAGGTGQLRPGGPAGRGRRAGGRGGGASGRAALARCPAQPPGRGT